MDPRFGATGTPVAALIDLEGQVSSDPAVGGLAVLELLGGHHDEPAPSTMVPRPACDAGRSRQVSFERVVAATPPTIAAPEDNVSEFTCIAYPSPAW